MRQQNEIGLRVFDRLAQRDAITVRRVFRQQIVLDQHHFIDLITGKFLRKCCDAFANHHSGNRPFRLLRDLLRGRQRLKADVIPFPSRCSVITRIFMREFAVAK